MRGGVDTAPSGGESDTADLAPPQECSSPEVDLRVPFGALQADAPAWRAPIQGLRWRASRRPAFKAFQAALGGTPTVGGPPWDAERGTSTQIALLAACALKRSSVPSGYASFSGKATRWRRPCAGRGRVPPGPWVDARGEADTPPHEAG